VAAFIFGGILDKCPDLKVCIAHGGGPACFGMGRLDRGWQVRSEARTHILKPPSAYQRQLYYDCITMSETALRFLINSVGADHVVLGSDWPYVRWDPSPVTWVKGLKSLTEEEKEKILWKNLEKLLDV
jgi:aminocarboxymuconate-semialdehyde decarboxylase